MTPLTWVVVCISVAAAFVLILSLCMFLRDDDDEPR